MNSAGDYDAEPPVAADAPQAARRRTRALGLSELTTVSDDETKQILRELLATQKEQLEFLRRMDQTYERQAQSYDDANARYRKETLDNSFANRAAHLVRALALLGVVAVLAYIVLYGLHSH